MIERYAKREALALIAQIEAKVQDPSDWIGDYEIELKVECWLREDDPAYREDDDNILATLKEDLKPLQDPDDDFGLDDGINHSIAQFIDGHPMQGEFHCWLYHRLYDHTDLEWEDLLRIGHIWVEIEVWYQHCCAVDRNGLVHRTPLQNTEGDMSDNRDAADDRSEERALFTNLRVALPALEALLARCSDQWGYEDPIYRFYHQSFKVYDLQHQTREIVVQLQALAPQRTLHPWFMQIVHDGTGKTFTLEDNLHWLAITRPIVEAFFHARYFLEMAVQYGKALEYPPQQLPSGWAALLYLYNLR